MAKDSGLFEMVLVLTVGGFAFLYITKNFCPGGAIPIEGLCYASSGTPGSADCLLDPASCGAVNTDPDYAGGSAGPKTAAPKRADLCTRAKYVWTSAGTCVCNRVAKRCASNQVAGTRNGQCFCATCPPGMKRRASSASDNICIKIPAGTVSGGSSSPGLCGKGYVRVGSGCVCNRIAKHCTATTVARLNSAGTCTCVGCSPGYTRGGVNGNQCLKIASASPSGVKVENGKLFIADYISRSVRTCTGKYVSNATIIRGWPSNINALARSNNYTQGAFVQYNNRPFAKMLRDTIIAVVRAYKGNMNPTCNQRMACLNSRSLRECGLA